MFGEYTPNYILLMSIPIALLICCMIRVHPNRGLYRFNSTMALIPLCDIQATVAAGTAGKK